MAYDLLAIPVISSEVERAFSGARNTIDDHRTRLGAVIFEMTELEKQWMCWPEALSQIRISDLALLTCLGNPLLSSDLGYSAWMGFFFGSDGVNQTPAGVYRLPFPP
jgi:hypothetical protein